MPHIHETINGKRLLEQDVPRIANILDTIARELKRSNDINEGIYLKSIADDVANVEPNLAMILDEYAK